MFDAFVLRCHTEMEETSHQLEGLPNNNKDADASSGTNKKRSSCAGASVSQLTGVELEYFNLSSSLKQPCGPCLSGGGGGGCVAVGTLVAVHSG